MKKAEEQTVASRRGFLKLASIGAAASGVAAATSVTAQAAEPAPTGNGQYRETEHVRRVYELSRF